MTTTPIPAALHARVRRRIETLLTAGLPPREHQRVWEHLRGCTTCRRYYEHLRRLEDALGGPAALSRPAAERLARLVVPAVAAPPRRTTLAGLRSTLALATAAGVALLLALVAVPDGGPDLQSKGSQAPPDTAALAVFRVDPERGTVERLRRQAHGSPVRSGTLLQLAYRNESWSRAFVVGVDASGGVQWYHPAGEGNDGMGVALERQVTDEPFGGAWRITAPVGPLRLYCIFADETMTAGDLRAALAAVADGGDALAVERLPLPWQQDSVLLEVVP